MTLSAVALHAATVLADTTPDGPENKKASALGLAVILLLCVACFFLFRSMARHLRKVREGFPGQARPGSGPEEPEARPAAPMAPVVRRDSHGPPQSGP